MQPYELKQQVCAAIDDHREQIISLGEDIFRHPELGYKEKRTASLVVQTMQQLGVDFRSGLALTGVKGRLSGRQTHATVGVMGELDAVICRDHPAADPETGAAHCCGHHAQVASMLGVGFGLVHSGAMEWLDGDVVLFAVPAEEYVELEFRQRLQQAGSIEFLGGKQELIRLGEFDDVDMTMMCHIESDRPGPLFVVGSTAAGFVGKRIRYLGTEAHAGGAPHQGVNALNAALLGIMGSHLQRETFRDDDHIRLHPIITKGGDLVNIVPADVRLETYVRGRTIDAILDASSKVNRALRAGAAAVGATVEIEEIPGYLPMQGDVNLEAVFAENAAALVGAERVLKGGFTAVSGDNGDLQQLMPSIIPGCGGVSGHAHTRGFAIADPEAAYIMPAKVMAMTIIDLLHDGAHLALTIKDKFQPRFDKAGYLNFWRQYLAE
ncbi:MAG: amidohydrolase [Bacillota bacterium]|jgi:amidohydrolase